jgi:CubicO group peptidase (beta-lactamase class C family)
MTKLMTARVLAATACVFLSALAYAGAAPAQPPAAVAPSAAVPAPAKHDMTAQDIEAFLDGLVPVQLEANDIAGATIAVVKDGKVLFSKGYGFADVEKRTPVMPETTMFRVGSITKLFTWTSVMQLVEQGKLDLDADVNTYLDVKVPHTFGKPVTLRNLMTHRGGFQEMLKNLGAQDTGKVDLGKFIRENMPDQIYEPGSTPSYSNYGAAMAGYIVERVSGEPFDAYVDSHILKPLGMTHSTLVAPLPKAFEADMSKGYVLASGGEKAFEIVNGYPAGSMSSSAIDMTKFILAHLNGGALGDVHILKPETTALMHDTVTTYDPRQNGIALGFYEETRNGMRIIGHGGDTVYFHSDLHLIPSQNMGFFISFNSAGRGEVPPRSVIWGKFIDRYFPYEAPKAEDTKTGLTAKDVAGSYLTSRRAETSLLKALTELSQPMVIANADGSLTVNAFTDLAGQPRKWLPLGNGVFQDKYGQARLVFVQGPDGIMRMLPNSAGVQIMQRVPPMRNALYILIAVGIASAVLLWNLLGFPVAALVRRHYRVDQEWLVVDKALRLFSMLSILALFTFIGGIMFTLISAASDSPWNLTSGIDPALRHFQFAGWFAAGGLFVVGAHAVLAWQSEVRGNVGRLKELAVFASYAVVLWFAWSMNFFDTTLRF